MGAFMLGGAGARATHPWTARAPKKAASDGDLSLYDKRGTPLAPEVASKTHNKAHEPPSLSSCRSLSRHRHASNSLTNFSQNPGPTPQRTPEHLTARSIMSKKKDAAQFCTRATITCR